MEFSNSPTGECSNSKEKLIKNNEQKINVNQFFVNENDQSSEDDKKVIITFSCFYRILKPICSIFILMVTIIPATVIEKLYIYERICIIIAGITFALSLLIISKNKIEISKNKSINKVYIKCKNFLCFSIKTIILDLENTHFYAKYNKDEDNVTLSTTLLIINDYKNLKDIDLDSSNIKQKPAQFFYSFDNIDIDYELEKNLNDFVGSLYFYNPLLFNINNYMKKGNDYNDNQYDLSEYMKFSDNFFTYHFLSRLNSSCLDCIKYILFLFLNLVILGGTVSLLSLKNILFYRLIGALAFLVVNIIFCLICKWVKVCKENIYRIDCIYSKDFDRIFIGLVKYNKKSYVNTFEFHMNNIERFILEKQGSKVIFNLKVIFKDKNSQQICSIKNKTKENLEGLAYLLNEKLINNLSTNNNLDTKE